MAPELVREQPYSLTTDIWSLGVVLYEIYAGFPPFKSTSIYSLINEIANVSNSQPTIETLLRKEDIEMIWHLIIHLLSDIHRTQSLTPIRSRLRSARSWTVYSRSLPTTAPRMISYYITRG